MKTSNERVKEFQERAKERKRLLAEKNCKEVSLILTNEQIDIIKAVSKKMGKKTHSELLFAITQPVIKEYCQKVMLALELHNIEKVLTEINAEYESNNE